MDRSYIDRNAQSRERLRALVARLSEEDLQRSLDDGWIISAVLAHLAFWDDYLISRWEQYAQGIVIDDLPDGVIDAINAANTPQWLALPPASAAELALRAAATIDAQIESLPPASVAMAVDHNRLLMIDRSRHRNLHLDEIERALAS